MLSDTPATGIIDGPLGLSTDGLLGLPAGLDAAFVPPSVPLAAGGTLASVLSRGKVGRWLLDLHFGGQVYRFSDAGVSVASRDLAADVRYQAGLDDLTPTIDEDSLSLSVMSSVDWHALRRDLGPLLGRRFVLRRWYAGQYLEDAFIVLQGTISECAFAAPEGPQAVEFTLERSELALSGLVEPCSIVVSDDTWLSAGYDDGLLGAPYPLVIGYPGRSFAAVPGLYVDTVSERIMIAGHRVEATSVEVWVGPAHDAYAVTHDTDDQGRTVALVDLTGGVLGTGEGTEYYVGYNSTDGGGVRDGDRTVVGLGDLLIYGSRRFSSAVFDFAEMESRRTTLNQYRIDAVINEPGTLWEEWIQQNLFELFRLETVNGPRGIYYRQIPVVSDPTRIRAKLATSGGGIRVSRDGPLSEFVDGDIGNLITVQYGPLRGSTSEWYGRVTIGPTTDSGALFDRRCKRSTDIFGARPLTIDAGCTWDAATAVRLARDAVSRYALPRLVASYVGGEDLLDLRKGDTVAVTDDTSGASFDDEPAVVTDLAFGPARTVVIGLMFPGDKP